jgi:cytoskeletal protein CcmA (bactofilin family)
VARDRERKGELEMGTGDDILSIIGPGMRIKGDLEARGSVRIEGMVEGTIQAGKAVVIGREGTVKGDILTEDAVLAGTVNGTIRAKSRLEVESTARVDGEIYAKTLKLDEGAVVNGQVRMGEAAVGADDARPTSASTPPQRPQGRDATERQEIIARPQSV